MTTLNPILNLFSHLWRFGNKKRIVLYLTLAFIANIIGLMFPLVIGNILNTIQEKGVSAITINGILLTLLLLFAIEFGFWIFHGSSRIYERENAFEVRTNYKKYLMDGILNFNSKWHKENHSGDSIDKIEKASNNIFNFSQNTYEITEMIVSSIGAILVIAYFNIYSLIPIIIMLIIAFTIIVIIDKKLFKYYKQINQYENDVSTQVYDTLGNVTTIKILSLEKLFSREIFVKMLIPFKVFSKSIKLNELKWALVSTCTIFVLVFVLGQYIYLSYINNTVILTGTIFILYGYIQQVNHTFYRFAYKYSEFIRQNSSLESIRPIVLQFKPVVKNKKEDLKNWNEIKINNLYFTYMDESKVRHHLSDINLKIKKSQRIAFIGESGSGKSTIMKIIRGLYENHNGNVYVDNKKTSFSKISRNITLIPQDPEIFATSARKNITVGTNRNISEINSVIKMSQLDKVIKKLPNKLETNVMEKGVSLSGGEKQRLALARGLLFAKDSEILLLDEPTSSVDPKTESKIYESIFKTYSDKTIISSIHRLHMLLHFDYIYLFKDGKIIAEGTFSDLIKNSTEFKLMWKKYTENVNN